MSHETMPNATIPNLRISQPITYQSAYETPEEDEAETTAKLVETLHDISDITAHDYGHAVRSVHAKSHGLLRGQLTVLDGLPPHLAQGLFANGKQYAAVMRLSTSPGDILDDSVSTPRGVGLKILQVEGERLAGSEAGSSQDFLMINGPAFLKADAKSFLSALSLLAKTTDKAPGLKKVLSAALRGTESLIESLGGESAAIKSMGGHPETHILGETFFTQVPHLYGDYMAKLSLVPVSQELIKLKDAHVDLSDAPDGLRHAVSDYFVAYSAEWDLRVQLCTDLEAMPIEDASIVWPEDASPFITVARLSMPVQVSWDEHKTPAIEDRISFSPWNGLAAHRPLGSIMRVRKAAYEASSRFRKTFNGCPMSEPQSMQGIAAV